MFKEYRVFQFLPLAFCLLTGQHWALLCHLHFLPPGVYIQQQDPSEPYLEANQFSFSRPSLVRSSNYLIISSSLWPFARLVPVCPHLSCTGKPRTGDVTPDVVSPVLIKLSLHLLATFFITQPRMLVILLCQSQSHGWLTFSTLRTKDPGLSAAELLSSCLPASMLWGCTRCCANILNAAASHSHDPQPTWGYYVSWTDHSFSPSLLALGLIGFSCTVPKCFLFIVFHTVRFVTWFPVLLEPRGSRRIRHFRTW